MSSAAVQVEKLEALLARVQKNRGAPRAIQPEPIEELFEDPPSLVPEPASFFAPEPTKAPAAAPVPRPPVRAATEPIAMPSTPASRPARTPLELAVEDKLERPSMQPGPQPQPSASAAVPLPMTFARPGGDEPVILADPPPATASRSIGQVVSKAAPIAAQTFGDILRRSLSLRPR